MSRALAVPVSARKAGTAAAEHHRRIAEFVEQFAMHLEAEGRPRMAGRVLAFLLVCEPPERMAAELARELTEHGLELMSDRPPAACARLQAVHALFALFEQRIPTLVDEWERRRGSGR